MTTRPYEVDHKFGDDGWEEQWFCPPPAEGISYQVIRQEWNDDQ